MLTNWGSNWHFAGGISYPNSWEEVQALISSEKSRVLGSGRSFWYPGSSEIMCISLTNLPSSVEVDSSRHQARVIGNPSLSVLTNELHRNGFAMPYLPSITTSTFAGSISTWTHGSGSGSAALSAQVSSLSIVTPLGLLQSDDPLLDIDSVLCTAGTLGVIYETVIDLVPQFMIQQELNSDLTLGEAIGDLSRILSSAYSVSVFIDIASLSCRSVLRKIHMGDETNNEPFATDSEFGYLPGQDRRRDERSSFTHSIQPSHLALPHFRQGFEPASGSELQCEFMMKTTDALEFLRGIFRLPKHLRQQVRLCEIRSSGPDDIVMGGSQGEPVICVHFTLRSTYSEIEPFVKEVSRLAFENSARPHLGKLFSHSKIAWGTIFPRLPRYHALKATVDPHLRLPQIPE